MRLLALDTATEACSAALWVDGQVLERFEVAGRGHTQRLMPLVQSLMAEAGLAFSQLDGLACGIGPGSFAGVRIGVGYAKGLALALDRPVVGVGSLHMLAQAGIDGGAQQVLAAIDARLHEVYFAAFARDGAGLAQPQGAALVVAPEALPMIAAGPWHALGSGWGAYEDRLRARVAGTLVAVDGAALPRAATALKLARAQLESGQAPGADALEPAYLRDKVALTLDEQRAARA